MTPQVCATYCEGYAFFATQSGEEVSLRVLYSAALTGVEYSLDLVLPSFLRGGTVNLNGASGASVGIVEEEMERQFLRRRHTVWRARWTIRGASLRDFRAVVRDLATN